MEIFIIIEGMKRNLQSYGGPISPLSPFSPGGPCIPTVNVNLIAWHRWKLI